MFQKKHEPTPARRGEAKYTITLLSGHHEAAPVKHNETGPTAAGVNSATMDQPQNNDSRNESSGHRLGLKASGAEASAPAQRPALPLLGRFFMQNFVANRDGTLNGPLDSFKTRERRRVVTELQRASDAQGLAAAACRSPCSLRC